MAKFKTDIQDYSFTLFDWLKVQDHIEGYEASDLKEIISQFDKFVESEVYPTRAKGDEEGVKLTPEGVKVPECYHQASQQFYQNGWYGLGYPEEIGGMPSPESVMLACTSIINGANVAFSMYYGLTKAAMNVVLKKGSEEQKNLIVPKMMEGAWGGTMCLTEPGAGSDVGAAKTTAEPLGDGTYKIKGVKIFISSGESDLYENNIHMVLAKTPGAPEGTKGLSLFIVPRFKINADGSLGEANNVKCTKIEEKMGIHGSATCEMTFGQDGDCIGTMIGEEFEGMPNMFIMMNEARLLCGMQGESQANLAYELSLQYATERSQFGKPIKDLPDVKRLLLKMRACGRGMRALNMYVGNLFDLEHKGEPVSDEIALLTPITKAYESEEGFNSCVDAIQVHGGYGYCTEYGIEQFARDTKIATIYEGTNAIQAADFVMRKVLKDQGKTFAGIGEKIQKTLANPKASTFASECKIIGESLQNAQAILKNFGEKAAAKNFDGILAHSHSFLMYSGNLIIAWLLLDQACLALDKIDSASGDEKSYLQGKVIDFKVFAQQYLCKNKGIAQSILELEEDLTSIEL